jgi:hypothetical protein
VVRRKLAYQPVYSDPIAAYYGVRVARREHEHALAPRRRGKRVFRRRPKMRDRRRAMPLRLRALEHGKPTCKTFDGSSKPSSLMANADLHETPSVKTRFPSGRTSTSSRETSLD